MYFLWVVLVLKTNTFLTFAALRMSRDCARRERGSDAKLNYEEQSSAIRKQIATDERARKIKISAQSLSAFSTLALN